MIGELKHIAFIKDTFIRAIYSPYYENSNCVEFKKIGVSSMLVKDKHFDNYDLSIYVNGVEVTVNAKFYDNIPLGWTS